MGPLVQGTWRARRKAAKCVLPWGKWLMRNQLDAVAWDVTVRDCVIGGYIRAF